MSQNPKTQGGKPPTFGNYGFTKHADKTRITGGKVGFSNKVSNVKWDKMMQNTGKSTFKTRSGEAIKARETKEMVAKMVAKAGGRGLSGKQIKQKLVRDHGMKYKDAGDIARAATYHYFEPPAEEGILPEDALRNVRASTQSANMAKDIKMGAQKIKERKEGGAAYSDRLGIEGIKHQATVGGEEMKTGISIDESSASANTPGGGKASVDAVEHEAAAGIGAGTGQKQEKKTKSTTVPQKKGSTQPVQISHGGGSTVSAPGKGAAGHSHNLASHGLPSDINIYSGGVVDSRSGKAIDFAEEIRKKKEAELGVNAADDEKTKSPSEGAADDYKEA